jgi:hypothetical protein
LDEESDKVDIEFFEIPAAADFMGLILRWKRVMDLIVDAFLLPITQSQCQNPAAGESCISGCH